MGNASSKNSISSRSTKSQYIHSYSNLYGASFNDVATYTSPRRLLSALVNALFATALVRCMHILIFFAGWSTLVTLINHHKIANLTFQTTLLTVVGTVLGFVISYRTTSSFERYNEGRKYWSQIILSCRTLGRAVWFHIPDLPPPTKADEGRTDDERRARILIEKKSVVSLIEAFAVAVKHYLRGEEGINYVDLYHLVKYLPSYNLAAEDPTAMNIAVAAQAHATVTGDKMSVDKEEGPSSPPKATTTNAAHGPGATDSGHAQGKAHEAGAPQVSFAQLPLPVTTGSVRRPGIFGRPTLRTAKSGQSYGTSRSRSSSIASARKGKYGFAEDEEVVLLPAAMPPASTLFDIFPFSLMIRFFESKGKDVQGKKAARQRAKSGVVTRNVPLEISMYLTSYNSVLAARKWIETPTNTLMINMVNQMLDALTGLERVNTTPIPFSYSIHLWIVTIIYCLAIPLMVWETLHWVTIPASVVISFIFFGFLVAGDEIENPFGYDQNDLDMDHFTHDIIRKELLVLTATPPTDPAYWAFLPENNCLFVGNGGINEIGEPAEDVTPEDWVKKGVTSMRTALAWY